MQSLRKLLPMSRPLIVFEAAARHASFTRAAGELGMSQAAVSQAVRTLEDLCGVALFARRHRAVELTEAGRRLHADVALGLGQIRKSLGDLAALGGLHVTLSASTAFASFWMLPRLSHLRAALPEVDLRIQTSDRDLDILAEGVPLAIRSGVSGDWTGCESRELAPEEIMVVASPVYAARHGLPEDAAALARHRLIHLEEPFRPCTDWEDWFAAAGLAAPSRAKGLSINDYVLVMQAVMAAEGVALGWRHLIEPMLSTGQLVQVSPRTLRTGLGFHLVWPVSPEPSPTTAAVRDWMLSAPLP